MAQNIVKQGQDFIERYALGIILVVVLFVLYKFTSLLSAFFGKKDKEDAERAIATAEHNEALKPATKKPLPVDPKKRPAVARENIKAIDAHAHALLAEEIRKHTDNFAFELSSTRRVELMKVATQMKKSKFSLKATVIEYKKLCNRDLYEDVRYTLGDTYSTWLASAGSYDSGN